jgi:hypothetical protein
MSELPPKPPREKRRVSLEGQDPIEVLKRLLRMPPKVKHPAKQRPEPGRTRT